MVNNVLVVYMARGRNDFDAGNIHYEDPEMATSEASAIWAQKVEISFGAHPLPMA
jgi:hypothetical protein